MKLKTNYEFKDKLTDKIHKVGSVFEVEDERGKELLSHPCGLVSLIEEDEKEPKKVKKSKK